MIQYTVAVEGMVCSMCEAHINEAVRKAFPVKKVTASRAKGQTVILSEKELNEESLRQVISNTGYQVGTIQAAPYAKRGLFSFGK